MKTDKQIVGQIGEDAVTMFLMKQGFRIVERNYREKWGELDIVAEKSKILHFVEVKTVSCESMPGDRKVECVTQETPVLGPADQMNHGKRQRMRRIIETYLLAEKVSDETQYQADLAMVWLEKGTMSPKIEMLWDILL